MPDLNDGILVEVEESYFIIRVSWDDYTGVGEKSVKMYYGDASGAQPSGRPTFS